MSPTTAAQPRHRERIPTCVMTDATGNAAVAGGGAQLAAAAMRPPPHPSRWVHDPRRWRSGRNAAGAMRAHHALPPALIFLTNADSSRPHGVTYPVAVGTLVLLSWSGTTPSAGVLLLRSPAAGCSSPVSRHEGAGDVHTDGCGRICWEGGQQHNAADRRDCKDAEGEQWGGSCRREGIAAARGSIPSSGKARWTKPQ